MIRMQDMCGPPELDLPAIVPALQEPVIRTSPIDEFRGAWWVVHTKARHEKALAADMDRKEIPYFLPLIRSVRRHGGRRVEVQIPLFPSYLFMCGGDEDRYATLMTHRAANVISVSDQERLKAELRHICLVTSSDIAIDLYPGLRRGRRCRVVKGSLAGLEGIVLRRRDICRIYIGVEVLGQSAELEIDPALLEVID